jgi:hypothetical protein
MFEHEQLLKSTPLFSWMLVLTLTLYWVYVHFYTTEAILGQVSLDLQSIFAHGQLYRLITGPLYPGVFFRNLLISACGAHVCSWYVINGYQARWERIIVAFSFNFSMLLLYCYFIDPFSF